MERQRRFVRVTREWRLGAHKLLCRCAGPHTIGLQLTWVSCLSDRCERLVGLAKARAARPLWRITLPRRCNNAESKQCEETQPGLDPPKFEICLRTLHHAKAPGTVAHDRPQRREREDNIPVSRAMCFRTVPHFAVMAFMSTSWLASPLLVTSSVQATFSALRSFTASTNGRQISSWSK